MFSITSNLYIFYLLSKCIYLSIIFLADLFSSSPGMAFYVAGGSSGLAAILLLYSIWPKRSESTERKRLLDNVEGGNWEDDLITEILVDPAPYLSTEIHAKNID